MISKNKPSEAEIEQHLLHQEAVNDEPTARTKQRIEPDPAYESGHCTAHDLLQVIVEKMHDLPAPNSGYVNWHHVKLMNEVNRALFAVIDIIEKETR